MHSIVHREVFNRLICCILYIVLNSFVVKKTLSWLLVVVQGFSEMFRFREETKYRRSQHDIYHVDHIPMVKF